jgi:hypothetical protein
MERRAAWAATAQASRVKWGSTDGAEGEAALRILDPGHALNRLGRVRVAPRALKYAP